MRTLPVSLTHNEQVLGWSAWGLQQLVLPAAISLLVPAFAPGMNAAEQNFLYLATSFLLISAVMLRFLRQSLNIFMQRLFYALRWAGICYILYWVSFLSLTFFSFSVISVEKSFKLSSIFLCLLYSL